MCDLSAAQEQGTVGGKSARSAGLTAAAHECVLRRRRSDRSALPAAGRNRNAFWGDDRFRNAGRKRRGAARYGNAARSRFDETGARRDQRFAAPHFIEDSLKGNNDGREMAPHNHGSCRSESTWRRVLSCLRPFAPIAGSNRPAVASATVVLWFRCLGDLAKSRPGSDGDGDCGRIFLAKPFLQSMAV